MSPCSAESATGVLAASTLTVVLYLLVRIHHARAGPRRPYGATLANQIEVARELNRSCPRDSSGPGGGHQRRPLPHRPPACLRTLYPAREPPLPPATLRLAYQTDDPVDGRIRLVGP